jgi:hypothetical protein
MSSFISVHIFKAVPLISIDELATDDERFYVISIYSAEANCEVALFFHDQRLFDEFVAQLKSQAEVNVYGAEG